MAGLPKEIYVVVAESGEYIEDTNSGSTVPIAFETNCLDIDSAKKFQNKIGTRYGKTAIYKAVQIEDEEDEMFDGILNKFCEETNNTVVEKGFWDTMHTSVQWLDADEESQVLVKATKDAYISQKIALIMSECGEALEAMRKNNYGLEKKDSFEDELADVFIRLSDLCGELNIDIEKQIAWKINHNKCRPKLHGKNF